VPPAYGWTGSVVDGDILAAVALFFFPLLTFYGRKQLVTSVTAGSIIVAAYIAYILLGFYAHLTPALEYIIVGVAAGVTFIAVLAAIDVGLFLVGATAGALMANLVLHFVRIPLELITHEFLFRVLFLVIPAVLLGLLTVHMINFLIRPMSAFVGAYLLTASLSRLLARLGLSQSAPLDPPVFFGPLDLTSPNPTPAFTVSLLLSYALVVLWLVVALSGIVVMYHSEFAYTEIERIHVDGKEYRRVNVTDPRAGLRGAERFGLRSGNGDNGGTSAYRSTAGRNVIQDL